MDKNILFGKKFRKEFKGIPKVTQKKIWGMVQILKKSVFPDGYDIKKLQGYTHIWRLRMGDYRLIYSFNERELILFHIRHRKHVYKNLAVEEF